MADLRRRTVHAEILRGQAVHVLHTTSKSFVFSFGHFLTFKFTQRPYMSIGSLREQIIYPDTLEDMMEKKISEHKLREILRMVSLEQIANRYSLDEVRDWKDTLSGGEKQRMAIARLFYHK